MNKTNRLEVMQSCPWCNTTEHLIVSTCGSMTADMPSRPHKVLCTHIDHDTVEGPVAYGRLAAIAAWNTRPIETNTRTGDTGGEPCAVCGNPNRGHFDHLAPFGEGYHEFKSITPPEGREPLGREFEKVWDDNLDKLFETDAPAPQSITPPKRGELERARRIVADYGSLPPDAVMAGHFDGNAQMRIASAALPTPEASDTKGLVDALRYARNLIGPDEIIDAILDQHRGSTL